MQPVLGLGTPDNGLGRKQWEKVMSEPPQTPPSTPTSVLDAMNGMVVDAPITETVATAFSSDRAPPSPSSSLAAVPSPELLGLFGYAVDITANVGYVNTLVPLPLECAVGGPSEGVIGGL